MHIVAIHSLNAEKESFAKVLAAALGATVYEALARLRVPGSGPVTVAVFAEQERAIGLLEKLETAGFKASVLTAGEIEVEGCAVIVRRFILGEHDLGVTANNGENTSIPFQKIDLIVRGTAIIRDITIETINKRSLSPGRAVLSGGMMLSKTTKNVREVITEERQGFVNIYATDGSALVLRENALVYDSLGPALRPSRVLNFTYLYRRAAQTLPGCTL